LLAVQSAGAYGMSMASNYNSRVRPAEVLVQGKTFRVVRARESKEDLWRLERR
jgi:diaminopimelate decarboxylase